MRGGGHGESALELPVHLRYGIEKVAHEAVVCHLEDRRLRKCAVEAGKSPKAPRAKLKSIKVCSFSGRYWLQICSTPLQI
jgi:hypothetical protein